MKTPKPYFVFCHMWNGEWCIYSNQPINFYKHIRVYNYRQHVWETYK